METPTPFQLLAREWVLLRTERAFWLVLVAYIGFLAYGGYSSYVSTRQGIAAESAAREDENRRWEVLRADAAAAFSGKADERLFTDATSPHYVGGYAGPRFAILPVAELAPLSTLPATPRQVLVTTFSRHLDAMPELDNPVNSVAGRFDVLFVILFLLPLMAIAVSYNLISVERETGRWPLTLSTGVSPKELILARCILRLVWLVAPAVATALVVCLAAAGRMLSVATLGLFALWTLAVLLYAGFWLALAAFANSRSASPSSCLIALMGVWIVLLVIVPNAIDAAAVHCHPPPDRLAPHLALRDLMTHSDERSREAMNWHYARHPEDLPSPAALAAVGAPVSGGASSSDMRDYYAMNPWLDERLDPIDQVARDRSRARQDFVEHASVLSPSLAFQLFTEEAAGVSSDHLDRFERSVAAYQAEWREFFGRRIMRLESMTPVDYEAVPRYDVEPESKRSLAARMLWYFAAIAAAAGAALSACALRRFGI